MRVLGAICTAYPNEKITSSDSAKTLWWNFLKAKEYSNVANNLAKHIETNKFPPTIAELIASEQPKLGTNYGDKNFDWDKFRREHINLQFGTGLQAGQWLHGEELEKALAEN